MVKYQVYKAGIPKIGNAESEYEDYCKLNVLENTSGKIDQIIAAISDGATETSFSRDWAKMLVRSFIKHPMDNYMVLDDQITNLSKRWYRILSTKKLPWYAEEKAAKGAFASLVGVRIFNSYAKYYNRGIWKSIAIGDSCLFHFRSDKLLKSFPLYQSDQFSNSPSLISSNLSRNKNLQDFFYEDQGEWIHGDQFVLASDSIGCWILKEVENSINPLVLLTQLLENYNTENFKEWISKMILEKKIKNDDISLILIKV